MKQAKEFFLRRIAVVLAVLMVVVMLPIGTPTTATETVPQEEKTELVASAPEHAPLMPHGTTADGLEYEVYSDHVEITDYTGSAAVLVIPAEIEGLPVACIGYSAFEGCTGLTSVTIPDSVSSIGDYAFYGCTGLTSVTIPDSVSSIGRSAFYGCTGLTSISVASGNTVYHSVGNCLIETASKTLIQGCKTSVIPSDGSVSIIGGAAFEGCTGLSSVTIPDSVTSIGGYAFYGCTGLTSISVASGNTVYHSVGNCLIETASKTLIQGCKTSVIPSDGSVTSIGSDAFRGCTGLTSVTIPDSVTSIDYYAFIGCTGLTSVKIGSGVTSIGFNAFSGCTGLTSVTIPDSVTSIGSSVFEGCTGLTSVKIGSGVTSIGFKAFSGCTGLTSVTIPDSMTSIGSSVFEGCTGLTSVTIPDSVTSIGSDAFSGCTGLTSVTIPDSVISIGFSAFYGCSSLTSIVFPESMSSISWKMFCGCSSLSEITIPESVTKIVYESFVGCDSLSDVYYGGSKSGWDAISIGHSNEDLTSATIHYAKADAHDTIDQLTELDYLAFSKIAYEDLAGYEGETLEAALIDKGIWNKKFEKTDILYSELCKPIASWKVDDIWDFSDISGFYAVSFENGNGDAVISFRGSIPLDGLGDIFMSDDAINDWIINDFASELLSMVFEDGQYLDAMTTYESVAYHHSNVAVTGHSLGGGLADLVSAHYGCKGVSMNAIAILDSVYCKAPKLYSKSFQGIDKWNFVDHANQHDKLAGSFENTFSTKIKPVVAHRNNSGDFKLKNIVEYHGLGSYLTRDSDGIPSLQDVVYTFAPNSVISNHMNDLVGSIDFGTSRADRIDKGLSVLTSRTTYGGNGADTLLSSVWGDTLIGGNGNDSLDGNRGSDTYYYCKGDGVDTIHDIGGDDVLYLLGFDEEDSISISEEDGSAYINVVCNGETIVKISKKNREHILFTTDSFKIILDYEIDGHKPKEFDITDRFSTSIYGQRVLVACPVHVEILDPDGNVVHTLTDGEVGSWYTDYGNFYVFEEENGEYGKVLDLVEGYTARIVGAGEGTMDVTYQVPVDGELTEPVSVSGVPVTEDLTATIEETEDGDVYLVIDEDSDGETDSERKLYGECPFTDVPEGSFYYEPVMWAVENGITNGATETTYNPNGTCLRAQVVTFLHRADGNPAPTSNKNPFTDVKSSDFFYQPVLWAVEKGITNGVSATAFGSYSNCNRAAVVTFLWRAAGSPEPESTNNPFVDVKTTDFFYKPVLWAVENGITNGVDATHFGPGTDCNRAQVVTFLYRAYN